VRCRTRSARNTHGDHERFKVSEFMVAAHFPNAQVIDDLPVDF
jgi:hypothetical protein